VLRDGPVLRWSADQGVVVLGWQRIVVDRVILPNLSRQDAIATMLVLGISFLMIFRSTVRTITAKKVFREDDGDEQ